MIQTSDLTQTSVGELDLVGLCFKPLLIRRSSAGGAETAGLETSSTVMSIDSTLLQICLYAFLLFFCTNDVYHVSFPRHYHVIIKLELTWKRMTLRQHATYVFFVWSTKIWKKRSSLWTILKERKYHRHYHG